MRSDMNTTATPLMATAGLSFIDVAEVVGHVANLLEKDGALVADLARNTLKMVQAVTSRNLVGVIQALTELNADFKQIAADIRAEFGI